MCIGISIYIYLTKQKKKKNIKLRFNSNLFTNNLKIFFVPIIFQPFLQLCNILMCVCVCIN